MFLAPTPHPHPEHELGAEGKQLELIHPGRGLSGLSCYCDSLELPSSCFLRLAFQLLPQSYEYMCILIINSLNNAGRVLFCLFVPKEFCIVT